MDLGDIVGELYYRCCHPLLSGPATFNLCGGRSHAQDPTHFIPFCTPPSKTGPGTTLSLSPYLGSTDLTKNNMAPRERRPRTPAPDRDPARSGPS